MGESKGSLKDNIFELVEIMGDCSPAVGCLRPPRTDFSECSQIAYLDPKIPILNSGVARGGAPLVRPKLAKISKSF